MRFKIDVRSLLQLYIMPFLCYFVNDQAGFCPCSEKLYRLNLKFKTADQ